MVSSNRGDQIRNLYTFFVENICDEQNDDDTNTVLNVYNILNPTAFAALFKIN